MDRNRTKEYRTIEEWEEMCSLMSRKELIMLLVHKAKFIEELLEELE